MNFFNKEIFFYGRQLMQIGCRVNLLYTGKSPIKCNKLFSVTVVIKIKVMNDLTLQLKLSQRIARCAFNLLIC